VRRRIERQVRRETLALPREDFGEGLPGRVERDGSAEAPAHDADAIGVDARVAREQLERPVGVGQQHGVGDGHLILDHAGHVPGLEAVHAEDGDAHLEQCTMCSWWCPRQPRLPWQHTTHAILSGGLSGTSSQPTIGWGAAASSLLRMWWSSKGIAEA
jgi:hypothetical protein